MKLLFVVSEHGFWAEECAEPLRELEQNHEVTVATPTGEEPEADPASVEGYEDFLDSRLKDPVPLMEAYRNREEYDGLVLPGGHGTLWDINQDDHVQQILREKMEDSGALIICHAVGVLGFTRDISDGRDISGFPKTG